MKNLDLIRAAVIVTAVFLVQGAWAQTFTGDILGTVTDPTGAVVPDATLELENIQTGAKQTTQSGQNGRYVFARLQPGAYRITAMAPAFKRYTTEVQLRVGGRLTVNIEMQLGEVTTTMQVDAAAQLTQPDDVEVGQVITEKSITALPLNGRNFVQLAQLSPGVLEIGTAVSPVTAWTSREDMSVVVAGLRETDTSCLLDGVETRSPRWGGSGFRPSVDAIQEFNIQRNAFTADKGWGTTVVNTVIKSGSNEVHGTVFHFLRNDAIDARNFFDAEEKPPFKQNQFGFTLGGPIVKNKLFAFGNFEGFRQRLTNTLQGNFPSPEELEGRFSEPVVDPTTGDPFPNNVIPQNRIDPVAENTVRFFPTPNRPEDPSLNFFREASRINDWDQFHVRVDYNLRPQDQLFVRFSDLDAPLTQPSLVEGFGLDRPLADQNLSIGETHVFGPKMVNEFRFGFNRNETFSVPERAFGPDLAKGIGLMNTSENPANFTLPGFNLQGFSGTGQGFAQTQETVDKIFQITDNVNYHSGNHSVKFGGEVRRNILDITNDFPSAPQFSFSDFFTGNSVGDFLLGLFDTAQGFVGDSAADFTRTTWAFYVQDDWKVHPKLTLNFGLRYEYPEPFSEDNNKLGYLDFNTMELVTGQETLFKDDTNNFAPRFGFAYNPWEDTVIRGGFGVFYDLVAANETQFHGLLLPPNSQITFLDNPRPTPTMRLENMFPDPSFGPATAPNTTDPLNRTPYVYQYNFNIQHEFRRLLFEIGYVGSTGHKLNRRFNMNLAFPDPNLPIQERRPFRGFGDILTSLNNGWSNYNGLNVKAEKRYSDGLLLLASYTYGKALDLGGPDEYVHRDLTGAFQEFRGPASLDTKHRFVFSYVYDLPIGRGKAIGRNLSGVAEKLLGGWQINGITTLSSGQPSTPQATNAWVNVGGRRILPTNRIGDGESDVDIREQPTLFPFFDVEDFPLQPRGTKGNAGRGVIIGPGIINFDFGLLKNTQVTERVNLQFRAEFFNIFNHAQFAGLGVNALSPDFGRITSAREPRDIQFGLKVIF